MTDTGESESAVFSPPRSSRGGAGGRRAGSSNPNDEYRLVAEIEGQAVAIAVLGAKNHEVRACCVTPEACRRRVGSGLLQDIERAAIQRGLEFLAAESSLTAEPFYAANGYFVLEHSEHSLHGGKRMSCVKMREHLVSRRGTTSRRAASG